MKVSPVASPNHIPVNGTPEATRTAKAVAAFNRGASSYDKPATPAQAQEHPVQNANNIAPEELSAINIAQEIDTAAPIETAEETLAAQPPEKTEEKDPALSRQFAQLARAERALRAKQQQQDQAYKAREAALAAREAAVATQPKAQGYTIDEIKNNVLGVLAEAGVSYDDITQQVLSRQPVDPQLQAHINKLEAKLAALEEANTTSQKSYQEAQQQQYQAAIQQITADAKTLVQSDPEAYEAITKTGTVKEIVNLIVKTHEKTGQILSVEEAAQEVENYLIDENVNMATSITKIKNRLQQKAQTAKPEVKTQATQTQTQPQMKTLTNATSTSRKLSAKERAVLAFKGELKS